MHLGLIARVALTVPLLAPQVNHRTVPAFLAAMAREGNVYNPAPTNDREKLFEEKVLNPYWRAVKDGSSEKKEAAFALIEQYCPPTIIRSGPDYDHDKKVWYNVSEQETATVRYHLAAAVLANTRLPKTQMGYHLLGSAVERSDTEFAELLLNHGVDPNALCFTDAPGQKPRTPLHCAATVKMAKFLTSYGASTDISARHSSLLYNATKQNGYAPELMAFYIRHGASPFEQDPESGNTCLHAWLLSGWFLGHYIFDNEHTWKGANVLLSQLKPIEIVSLFSIHNKDGLTPIDVIDIHEKHYQYCEHDCTSNLKKLKASLRARLSVAQAQIAQK